MADTKRQVPNLRFKGFTDDWEQRKLGTLFQKNIERNDDEKFNYNQTLSVSTMTFKPNGNGASAKSLANYKVLRLGDVAFEGHPNKQFSYGRFVVNDNADGIMSPRFATIRPIKAININYWKNYLHNENIMKYVLVKSTKAGTMMNELVYSDLYKQVLKVPNITEQVKIGNLLQKIEIIITLQQRKLDLLKQLKKGLLQKMFADKDSKRPVLQFKIFHDDWEQRKLGDLIKEFSIKSKIEDEYKVLSSTNSGMKFREGRVTGTSNLGYKIIKNGDLVLSPQNLWLGNININNIGKGLVSPSYKTFKLINIDSSFINPQLRTQKMLEEYKNSSTQGASVVRRNLEIDSFYQIKIFVPTISEQEKIGSFFQRLDNTIVLQHQKLAKCQSVKKSLLQQMFI